MNKRLVQTNRDLLHQVSVVRAARSSASVASVMGPYVESVLAMCEALHKEALRQLKDLSYGLEDTIPDILEATQRAGNLFDLVNTRFAPPIIRYADEDRLPLAIINWVHEAHDACSMSSVICCTHATRPSSMSWSGSFNSVLRRCWRQPQFAIVVRRRQTRGFRQRSPKRGTRGPRKCSAMRWGFLSLENAT